MSSLSALSNIGQSALMAQEAAMQVTGQNIANAQTPGYSRQTIALQASTPENTPNGVFGTGVSITAISRDRDALLDQQYRTQSAPASGFQERSTLLGQIQDVYGEPSTTGLANTMDNFFNSWSELASNPADASAKAVVQQAGAQLASTFNTYVTQLSNIAANTRTGISNSIAQVNTVASQIAAVNQQIVAASSSGASPNDLMDQRDTMLDQLSQLVPISVSSNKDGSDQVNIGGIQIVNGTATQSLALSASLTITTSTGDALRSLGGQIGAMLAVLNTDLPAAQSGLDTLAASIVSTVNAEYANGAPAGAPIEFFAGTSPKGTSPTAQSMCLSGTVAADSSAIVTSRNGSGAGDNTVALAIAALQTSSTAVAGPPSNSFSGAYSSLVTTVANAKNASDSSTTVYQALQQQADTQRQSVSGVNTDEELTQMIQLQQSYVAASKLIQTIQAMSTALLSIAPAS
jgi:flagellar hook-associated protein 1 FlgK